MGAAVVTKLDNINPTDIIEKKETWENFTSWAVFVDQTPIENVYTWSQTRKMQTEFNDIKWDLFRLLKSPNPISLYMNANEIKEKFDKFIASITDTISQWFDLKQDWGKSFIYSIYKKADYDKVWMTSLHDYIKKALLKVHNNESDKNIQDFLKKFGSKLNLDFIKKVYNDFWIKNMIFSISLDENFIEHFLEKVYVWLEEEKKKDFLSIFSFRIIYGDIWFNDAVKIVWKFFDSYEENTRKKNSFYAIVKKAQFKDVKSKLDIKIKNYNTNRATFYSEVNELFKVLDNTDKLSDKIE